MTCEDDHDVFLQKEPHSVSTALSRGGVNYGRGHDCCRPLGALMEFGMKFKRAPRGTATSPQTGSAHSCRVFQHGVAFGADSESNGVNALAFGPSSRAIGNRVISVGSGSTSEGDDVIALGASSSAIGKRAISLGSDSNTQGNDVTALGAGSIASGSQALAIGDSAEAHGVGGVAIGPCAPFSIVKYGVK